MPIELDRLEGYRPTEKTMLNSLGVTSLSEVRNVVLDRCKNLFEVARDKGKTLNFGTPHDFIVCKSTDFFSIFAKMGYGSTSIVIKDDLSSDSFFLMFEDKIPEQFYPIAAAHEATEYRMILEGIDQEKAHRIAETAELEKAKSLSLSREYNNFLKANYPKKYRGMRDWSKEQR